MSTFNFIESFFMLSLGITFVLIVLLVYHFKQRIGAMEQKCDTMFDIVQNLVKELNMVKGNCMMCYGQVERPRESVDEEQYASDDDEQEEDDDESTEDEEQAEEQDASDDESTEDEEQDASDDEEQSVAENNQPKMIEMSELLPEPEDIVIHKIMNTDYKKKTVSELKALAIEKGLAKPPVKMSKTELLKLF